MNRLWISSLSLAGVVGSGGAAWASLSDPGTTSAPPVEAVGISVAAPASTVTSVPTAPTTVSYQVGAAGIVTVDLVADGATVTAVSPGAGWTVGAASAAGAHLEVVFTDALQVVTFAADLVDGSLVPSVSAVAQPGAPVPAPMAVTEISAPTAASTRAPAPPAATAPIQPTAPTTPLATPAPVVMPAPSATTAPSGGGESEEHDDDQDEDHDDDRDEDHDDDHDDDHDEDHEGGDDD
jgi:hypothetical protein